MIGVYESLTFHYAKTPMLCCLPWERCNTTTRQIIIRPRWPKALIGYYVTFLRFKTVFEKDLTIEFALPQINKVCCILSGFPLSPGAALAELTGFAPLSPSLAGLAVPAPSSLSFQPSPSR